MVKTKFLENAIGYLVRYKNKLEMELEKLDDNFGNTYYDGINFHLHPPDDCPQVDSKSLRKNAEYRAILDELAEISGEKMFIEAYIDKTNVLIAKLREMEQVFRRNLE